MKIHEYQGKQLLRDYHIPVPKGRVAFNIEEALRTSQRLESDIYVVKAQIHAGGRGKAGGVKIAKNSQEVEAYAKELLGKTLVTAQTGPEGKEVNRLLIEEGCAIKNEYYVGMVLDRNLSKILLMVSKEGGTEIEEVAAKTPEKIIKEVIDPYIGLTVFQGRRLAQALDLPNESISDAVDLFQKLYQLYMDKDCTIVEINPLVLTESHNLLAVDVKLNFDSNALYRHKDIVALRDFSEEDAREIEASAYDLSYVALDGQIGCMVNGAGLAMATMDIIKQYGGSPANFLDVGGSATVEKVREAFKIVCSDKQVKGIFINIFGGIMKCDVIAEGVIQAAKELDIKLPIVVRLEGTNVEKGRSILAKSSLNIIVSDTMADGAYKVVALTK